ncbi:hypothetical protein IFM89_012955, partial [Coptis chinensis]
IHSLLKQIGSEEVLVVLPQLDLLLSRSFITSQSLLESNWTREGPDCFASTWVAFRKEEFGSSVEHDDRSVKWLRDRQKKNGEFLNDATMEIVERIVEDGDTLSKMLPNLEISTPKVKDAGIPKMKKTPTNHEFSTPKEEKHDLLGLEKARKDNKGKQIKDFGVVAKSKKALPNFKISTPQEKEETLDEMERSIREYGDMLDNTMESSDNIVIPIERELFGEEIELGHFSIEKSDLLDICSMDWLSVSCMTTNMNAIRAFTYVGGKRMMAGPNWQVVKVSFFSLLFPWRKTAKKHKKAMPGVKED